MQLAPVTCNQCGASLQIPESAKFVTCRHCNSQLEIKRTDSVITTETLQQINTNTASMAEDIHALRHSAEIARLDREWAARREKFMVRNKDGSSSVPTTSGSIVGAIVMGVVGVIWTIASLSFGSSTRSSGPFMSSGPFGSDMPFRPSGPPESEMFSCIFPLIGVGIIIAAIVTGIMSANSANEYEAEERQYQERRRKLLANMPKESVRR